MTSSFRQGPAAETLPPPPGATTGERAPKRPGRPKGSAPMGGRRPASTTRSLEPQIASTLMALNFVCYVIPALQADRLDELEITALARAIDAEARNSAQFRKLVNGALTITSGGQLLGVVAIIAARRASRHGFLPPEADGQLRGMLASSANAPQPVEDASAARRDNAAVN